MRPWPWAGGPSLRRDQRRILAASIVLGVALVVGQPSLLAKSPCIWASADLIIAMNLTSASVNETEVRAFATDLGQRMNRPATTGDSFTSNGNFTQPVRLADGSGGGVGLHVTRLLFSANESAGTAQVDIHIYLMGPEAARVGEGAVEALRDSANIEAFDITDYLRAWFGPTESRYHGNGSGAGDCCPQC